MQYNMGTSRSLCPINAKDEMRFSSLALSDQKRHRERERERSKQNSPNSIKKRRPCLLFYPYNKKTTALKVIIRL